MFEVAVESLCQVADNAQAASLPELQRRGNVNLRLASHEGTSPYEFDANTSVVALNLGLRACTKAQYRQRLNPKIRFPNPVARRAHAAAGRT